MSAVKKNYQKNQKHNTRYTVLYAYIERDEIMERKYAWHNYDEQTLQDVMSLGDSYRQFLDNGKTERECIIQSVEAAKKAGYVDLKDLIKSNKPIKAGDKIYYTHMDKSIALFNIGTDDLDLGMNILGAHIDSPRIDVKQNPQYEDSNLVFWDTHYYGGIKKYHWVAMPLAIHGVVVKTDGTRININIGDKESDPVFCITDLLPHLGQEQMQKNAAKVIEGEALDLLIGSRPVKDEEKEGVTKFINNLLEKEYGFVERDLLSAELEIVPAGKARDMGFDRSMVLAYGQDDRVCAYTSLVAMLEVDKVKRTTCCLLVDKEEIGSVGATGMQSKFFENAVAEILTLMGKPNSVNVRRTLENSRMLSSDVSAGYDPLYASAFEKKNASYLGMGVVFNKFTGSRGKSGSNDANAEYMGFIRRVMESNNVTYQTAELGKVDLGGGGTIAYIMALYGMNVIDCGVAVLSMHAPWEVTSKADIYEAKRCYVAFLNAADETIQCYRAFTIGESLCYVRYRMKQTELGAAIEAAKGEATEVKTVKVDIFDIPETKANEYIATREEVAKAAMEVMKPYCVTVKRETLDEDEGEAVVGYYVTGEILMCVILDPFEVPVMKVALDKGTLKEYILAANELTEDMLASLDK